MSVAAHSGCYVQLFYEMFDFVFYYAYVVGWFEALHDIAVAVDEEFCEVPFYVVVLGVVGVDFRKVFDENLANLVVRVETFESLLAF